MKLVLIIVIVLALFSTSAAEADDSHTMYFNSIDDLKRFGVTIGRDDERGYFPHHCYSYRQLNGNITISDKLIFMYKEKGFSLKSACMALTGYFKFNPEDGERLTTFVFLRTRADGSRVFFYENPFALPRCFSGGLPYTDCEWNYDVNNGRLSRRESDRIRQLGERINKYLQLRLWRHDKTESLGGNARSFPFDVSKPSPGGPFNGPDNGAVYFDYSSDFPRGFGYSIGTQGELGGIPNPEALRKASESRASGPRAGPGPQAPERKEGAASRA